RSLKILGTVIKAQRGINVAI
ncbi:hypothetical protein BMETH_34111772402263, partial [methanotrophic bacterial endosymbiont of Bathymodiolus sp.]